VNGDTAADRRIHPATIALRFVKEVPSTVLALPAGLAFISDLGIGRALLVAAVMAIVMLTLNWLAWSRFRYGVGEREIVIESGVLSRTRRSIPFDRIQDVDIEQPLLARLVGLAKVRIETGGAGRDEGLLDSVTLAEANRLRAVVRASHGAAPSALAPAPAAARPLFEMDLQRVLLFGLFNFSLAFIAGIFAALQTFDDWLPFDLYDWLAAFDRSYADRFTPAAVLALLLLAALLGLAAGMLRTLSRDYGFRLTAEGGRFRRERGLFTRSEVVISKKRLQLALVETGLVRRRLGWFGLSFQTLGSGADAGGLQSAAPFGRKAEVAPILEEANGLRMAEAGEMIPVSSRHVLRILAALPVLLLTLVVAAALWKPWVLLILLALPLFVAFAARARRFHRYRLEDRILFVARGLWRQRLWIVPIANVQAVSLSRSPLQRCLGLATLAFDTAGASLLNTVRIVDLRIGPARELADEVAAYSSGRKSGTDR
jgi:putative membrane protein